MNHQQLAEWRERVKWAEEIQREIELTDKDLLMTAEKADKVVVVVGPLSFGSYSGIIETTHREDVRGSLVEALIRILKDRKIALQKEFREL